MPDLATPSLVKGLMARHHLHCRKSLGQNFLVDGNIVNKIVGSAGLAGDDTVVEIGPGLGVLTMAAAEAAEKVIAVEIDRNLVPVLGETLSGNGNVEIVNRDALEVDFDRLVYGDRNVSGGQKPYVILANLPYYITTPLIMHILNGGFNYRLMVIMIQQEVARRLGAPPGGKDYGSLTVAVGYHARVEYLFRVPRTVFIPRPEVDSAIVRLSKRDKPAVDVPDEDLFFRVVRGSFGQRRKTILNALGSTFKSLNREELTDILNAAGINPVRRGETLSLDEFAEVTKQFYNYFSPG
ncbi:MAG: 16S rRNA methyltransferase [Peptococcaceae bacterium BRH_c4b]|nr:MAG: 16S rRNA methyltransferase [Peptococcaceae bacterium BRH_c4b]